MRYFFAALIAGLITLVVKMMFTFQDALKAAAIWVTTGNAGYFLVFCVLFLMILFMFPRRPKVSVSDDEADEDKIRLRSH